MADNTTSLESKAPVGRVQLQENQVIAISAQGEERSLAEESPIYANDIIQTGADAFVVIQLDNGLRFDLGRNSKAVIDDDVLAENVEQLRQEAVLEAEILAAALEAGTDPLQVGEAPAAGLPGAGGDTSDANQGGVVIERTGERSVVESGYDTVDGQAIPVTLFESRGLDGLFDQNINGDRIAPTLAISTDDADLMAGETATVTFTFSEAVNGFDASDISPTNGTISGLTQVNATTWTATFTPAPDTDGTANISVADNSYTDVDGNNGAGDSLDIELSGGNDAPMAVNDTASTTIYSGGPTSGNVLLNDSDIDGPAAITVANPGTYTGDYGSLILNQSGDYSYSVDLAKVEQALDGPTNGLVSRWEFENQSGGRVADTATGGARVDNLSLNGNNLVPGGPVGNAVQLGGTSRMTMSNSADINLGIQEQRTVSLHFNADSVSGAGRQVLYEEGAQVRGLNIFIENGRLYAGGWNTPGGESNWSGDWVDLGEINAGQWYHVALELDADSSNIIQQDALTAYLDGVDKGSVQGSKLWSHSGDVSIGGSGGNSRYPDGNSANPNLFSGQIDEARIYNAVLSEDQITELANPLTSLTDSFDYQASDSDLLSNIANLNIEITTDPDSQPVAVADSFVLDEDAGTTGNVSVNDSGLSNTPVVYSIAAGDEPANGSVAMNPDGTFEYTPNDNFNGVDSFTYTVTDSDGDSSTATVILTVDAVADVPVLEINAADQGLVESTILSDTFDDGTMDGWVPTKLIQNSFVGDEALFNARAWQGQTSDPEWQNNWTVVNGKLNWNAGGSNGSADEYGFIGQHMGSNATATDYTISTDIFANESTEQNNGVGIVFGYQDDSNYYLARWESPGDSYANGSQTGYPGQANQLSLLRMVNGNPEDLASSENVLFSGEFNMQVDVNDSRVVVTASGLSGNNSGSPQMVSFVYSFLAGEVAPELTTMGLYTFDNDNGVTFDNVSVTMPKYQYIIDVFAATSGANETLSDVTLSNMPAGISLLSGGVELMPDVSGDYSVTVNSGTTLNLSLWSDDALTETELNSIGGSVIATDGSDSATVNVNAHIAIVEAAGDQVLIGTDADEYLDGGAGADSLLGGAGDDILIYDSLDLQLDGGSGVDTLKINEVVPVADITQSGAIDINGIEIISMKDGSGGDALSLSLSDVLDITDGNDVLQVNADSNDSLQLSSADNWTETQLNPGDAAYLEGFVLYEAGTAKLYIEEDVNVMIL